MRLNFYIGSVTSKRTGVAYSAQNKGGKSKRIYLASKDVAKAFADDEKTVINKYRYELKKPYVVSNDGDFDWVFALIQSFIQKKPNAYFHPDVTEHVNRTLEKKGFDGLIIEPSAMQTQKGYDEIGSTYGEAQIIVFDRKNVQKA